MDARIAPKLPILIRWICKSANIRASGGRMGEIEEIDAQLTPIFARLAALSTHLSFSYVCDLSDEESIAKQTYGGIYRIDICTAGEHADFGSWVAKFRAEWDLPEYKAKFTCT